MHLALTLAAWTGFYVKSPLAGLKGKLLSHSTTVWSRGISLFANEVLQETVLRGHSTRLDLWASLLYCAFHKHANSKVEKPPQSQLRFSLPSIIITITSNEAWNTQTHEMDRNPPITNHKPWPFEPVNPFTPGDFADKRVLKLVEWFSSHCRAIKS